MHLMFRRIMKLMGNEMRSSDGASDQAETGTLTLGVEAW